MESKKRKADLQLTAENYEEEPPTSVGDEVLQQANTHRYLFSISVMNTNYRCLIQYINSTTVRPQK